MWACLSTSEKELNKEKNMVEEMVDERKGNSNWNSSIVVAR